MSSFMIAAISAIHIFACAALVVSILLQSGKGGGLAGAFGAGSSQTLFGGRGAATFLTRASTVLAVVFFLTSLTLGLTSSRQNSPVGRSLMQEEARRRAAQQQPTGDQGAGGTAPGSAGPGPAGPAGPGATAPGAPAPTPGSEPLSAPPTRAQQTPPASQTGGTPDNSGSK